MVPLVVQYPFSLDPTTMLGRKPYTLLHVLQTCHEAGRELFQSRLWTTPAPTNLSGAERLRKPSQSNIIQANVSQLLTALVAARLPRAGAFSRARADSLPRRGRSSHSDTVPLSSIPFSTQDSKMASPKNILKRILDHEPLHDRLPKVLYISTQQLPSI